MLEKYFVKPSTVDRFRGSWMAAEIEKYVGWLVEYRYSTRCIWRRVPLVFAFGEFAAARECSDEARAHFMEINPRALSGALIPIGSQLVVLDHDGHSFVRRRATLSHEVSHVLLEHQFSMSVLLDSAGCRTSDSVQEEEATELSGELLIPFSAAVSMARKSYDDTTVSSVMDVSIEFARWRMNASGARKIASRRKR